MPYFYISFATTEEFLGATVINAEDPREAVETAEAKGFHPGGEAAVWVVDNFDPRDPDHAPFLERLVGKKELVEERGGISHADMEALEAARLKEMAVVFNEDACTD